MPSLSRGVSWALSLSLSWAKPELPSAECEVDVELEGELGLDVVGTGAR